MGFLQCYLLPGQVYVSIKASCLVARTVRNSVAELICLMAFVHDDIASVDGDYSRNFSPGRPQYVFLARIRREKFESARKMTRRGSCEENTISLRSPSYTGLKMRLLGARPVGSYFVPF